jgi:hypothetical protein
VNNFKISALIIPIDKILEKYFKLNKQSDMKKLMKSINSVLAIIKSNISIFIKSGR